MELGKRGGRGQCLVPMRLVPGDPSFLFRARCPGCRGRVRSCCQGSHFAMWRRFLCFARPPNADPIGDWSAPHARYSLISILHRSASLGKPIHIGKGSASSGAIGRRVLTSPYIYYTYELSEHPHASLPRLKPTRWKGIIEKMKLGMDPRTFFSSPQTNNYPKRETTI